MNTSQTGKAQGAAKGAGNVICGAANDQGASTAPARDITSRNPGPES